MVGTAAARANSCFVRLKLGVRQSAVPLAMRIRRSLVISTRLVEMKMSDSGLVLRLANQFPKKNAGMAEIRDKAMSFGRVLFSIWEDSRATLNPT